MTDIISKILTNKELVILIGDAIIVATLQFSIAGVELSSRFGVIHYANTQKKLQHTADSLNSYLLIGVICAILLSSLFYLKNNMVGFTVCLLSNLLIMSLIYYSYLIAFRKAKDMHGLEYPKLFNTFYSFV